MGFSMRFVCLIGIGSAHFVAVRYDAAAQAGERK
jgi:hypothetical protein